MDVKKGLADKSFTFPMAIQQMTHTDSILLLEIFFPYKSLFKILIWIKSPYILLLYLTPSSRHLESFPCPYRQLQLRCRLTMVVYFQVTSHVLCSIVPTKPQPPKIINKQLSRGNDIHKVRSQKTNVRWLDRYLEKHFKQ